MKGEFLSFGKKLHIYDALDNEVGFVRQKVFSWMPTFYIEINGEEIGSVRKKFTFFRPTYNVDYRGWTCEGDFLGWDYAVYDDNGYQVASIRKKIISWGDTYIISYDRAEDELPVLMLVLAIDAANEQAAAAASSSSNS